MKNSVESKLGFTLIELLVVVLIIGILVAVAVPQYKRAVEKAKFTQLITAAHAIEDAQKLFYLANGKYATKAEDLGNIYRIDGTNFVIPSGRCHVTSEASYCVGESVSFYLYHANASIQCCSYSFDGYAGDLLCQQEIGVTTWMNKCGSPACHCYYKYIP